MAGKTTPLGVAARIAGAQHGVVARRQLVRAGLTGSAVEHVLAAGRLLPLYRGVYAVGHRPVGPRTAAGWQTVRVTDRQLNRTRAETAARFGLLLSSRAR